MFLPASLLIAALIQAQEPACSVPVRRFEAPTEEELAGHRRMLALLEDVRANTPKSNAYLGDGPLRELEEKRASLDPKTTPAKKFVKLDYDLGIHLLRLGRPDEALQSLLSCYQRLQAFAPEEVQHFGEKLRYEIGVAAMRKGENDNCLARHRAESCLLPIEGSGVHVDQAGSRAAMHWLREARAASADPGLDVSAKWLLNIAAMTVGEYPQGLSEEERIDPSVFASEAAFPRFPDVAPELGLNNSDLSGGAIVEDFDRDGWLDILTSSWDTSAALHYNRSRGDGTFEDLSHEANLDGLYGGLNLLQGDYDSDGWTDVFVLRGAWLFGPAGQIPRSLLQNRGGRSFLDVTLRAGLNEHYYPSQGAAFADYDLDGDLDLYVGSEAGPDDPFPGQLFQNRGDGTFKDVAQAAGVANLRFCKGVTWGDYDGDRYPDLYASNLGGKNRLYHNEQDGTFEDVAERAGVTRPHDSFPTWFWDFDNDGALDLYVASYQQLADPTLTRRVEHVAASYLGLPCGELACLYKGDGRGGFIDVALQRNLKRLLLPMGANFGDLDNDGFLDCYLGTGYPGYDGLMPNVLYWNRAGEKFLDVSAAAGMGHLQKGHGVAIADLDEDGDLDVFEQMGGAFPGDGFGDVLFQNPGFGTHWLKLELVGVHSNRSAFGTRIHAELGPSDARRHLWRWVGTGGSFGCNPLRQQLGLGGDDQVARLEFYWPKSDTKQVFENVPADVTLEVVEGAAEYRVIRREPVLLGGVR